MRRNMSSKMYHSRGYPWGVRLLGLVLFAQALCLLYPVPGRCKREHLVYFPNSAHELNVYQISGQRPGKTLMLIGGIQGNEPGGFLSADLYADMSLEKGNLIVIPRTNFYSILLNQRGPHGDMNRKFGGGEKASGHTMEDKIVSIVKKLIGKSDYLLNLHDGSGYYAPRYIDKWRNPSRFGQSIIADCERYAVHPTGQVLELGRMARKVISEVNPHINNDLHRFHFNNTRTGDPDSIHKEQRRSATYYALTKHHIPAFGVEISKFLPSLDLKVRYHKLVINAFMKLFDIVPEYPGWVLDPPVLKYLVLSVNGQTPIVVKDREEVHVQPGDTLHVAHIEANYERGLSLDILGWGDLNDFRKDFVVAESTRMIVRKDNKKIAEIPIRVSTDRRVKAVEWEAVSGPRYLLVQAKGLRLLLADGETLELLQGDTLKILDVLPPAAPGEALKVNFKGFVSNWANNKGEDRGSMIHTGKDLLKRYSLHKKGELYQIVVLKKEELVARFLVRLRKPTVKYLVFKAEDQSHHLLRPGESLSLSQGSTLCLEEIQTDLHDQRGLHLCLQGRQLRPGEKKGVKDLLRGCKGQKRCEALIKKGSLVMGRVYLVRPW